MFHRPKTGWNIQRITTHSGEILQEEFMGPLSISQNRLASDLRVPPGRINQIIKGKRSITSDTALPRKILRQQPGVLDEPANHVRPQQNAS
jgi:addiction module HigA family antidote